MVKPMSFVISAAVCIIFLNKLTLGRPVQDSPHAYTSAEYRSSLTHKLRTTEPAGGRSIDGHNYYQGDIKLIVSEKDSISIPMTERLNKYTQSDTSELVHVVQNINVATSDRHILEERLMPVKTNRKVHFELPSILERSVRIPGHRIKRVADITRFSKRIVVPHIASTESLPSGRSGIPPEDSETAHAQPGHWPIVSSNNESIENNHTASIRGNSLSPRVEEATNDLRESATSQHQPSDSNSLTDASESDHVIDSHVRVDNVPIRDGGVQPRDMSETNGAEVDVLARPVDDGMKGHVIEPPVSFNDTHESGNNDDTENSNNSNTSNHNTSHRNDTNNDLSVSESLVNSGNGSNSAGRNELDDSQTANNSDSSHAILPATVNKNQNVDEQPHLTDQDNTGQDLNGTEKCQFESCNIRPTQTTPHQVPASSSAIIASSLQPSTLPQFVRGEASLTVTIAEKGTPLFSAYNILKSDVAFASTTGSLWNIEGTRSIATETLIANHASVTLISEPALSSTKISGSGIRDTQTSSSRLFRSSSLHDYIQPFTTSWAQDITTLANQIKQSETSTEIHVLDEELNNEGNIVLMPSSVVAILSTSPSQLNLPQITTYSTNYLRAETSYTGVPSNVFLVPFVQVAASSTAFTTVSSSSAETSSGISRSSAENSAIRIQISQSNTTTHPDHPAGDRPAVVHLRPEIPEFVHPVTTTTTTQTTASNPGHPNLPEAGTESKTSSGSIGNGLNSTTQRTIQSNSDTDSNAIIIQLNITGKPRVQFTSTDFVRTSSHGVTTSIEPPSSYMELKFGMSWLDFCQQEVSIRGEIVQILQERNHQTRVTVDQIQVMDTGLEDCPRTVSSDIEVILVRMYLMNKSHQYDRELTLVCANILKSGLPFDDRGNSSIKGTLLDIHVYDQDNVDRTSSPLNRNSASTTDSPYDSSYDPRVIIAVILAVVGGCCCIGLIALQVIVRRRNMESRLNTSRTGRSNHHTGSDTIQLSSVVKSRPNSGLFNPGLDIADNSDPSNPLNYVQLSNFCADEKNIAEEYQKLPQRLPRQSMVPTGEEDKNRYANVIPLVHTRVKLSQDGTERRSSYINANYVTGTNSKCQSYIATQAPTEKTTLDFWTMIWQQECKAVVMLTQMEEQGQRKCANYWPELVGKSAAHKYGDFQIELKHKDVHQEYILSRLEINNLRKIETRELDHFWYTCWPPNGLPEPISLVKLVLDVRPKYENGSAPLVVHCSPGTGRTCTFIALDLCMRQFETRRMVNVMATVYGIRQERAGAIQNKEQYSLLYNALNEYATIVMTPGISAASSAATLQALLSG